MSEEELIISSRMMMAVGLPIDPAILESILEIVELVKEKGNKANMEDLQTIVEKSLAKQKQQQDESNRTAGA